VRLNEAFNPSSDVGHEAPGRNVSTKATTSRKKGARGASQTVATSPRSQHAIDPVFSLDTIKMYARRDKPVWLSPTKDNLKDHNAILYIPPSCDEIAGSFRGEATKASAESKAEVGITNMHNEASHTHGKPNCDRRTALLQKVKKVQGDHEGMPQPEGGLCGWDLVTSSDLE